MTRDRPQPTIRGISIYLEPLPRFGFKTQTAFRAFFDEKPIGRGAQAHQQICLMLGGKVDLADPKGFADRIGQYLCANARVAEDAGIVVIADKGGLRARKISDWHCDRIKSAVSRILRH